MVWKSVKCLRFWRQFSSWQLSGMFFCCSFLRPVINTPLDLSIQPYPAVLVILLSVMVHPLQGIRCTWQVGWVAREDVNHSGDGWANFSVSYCPPGTQFFIETLSAAPQAARRKLVAQSSFLLGEGMSISLKQTNKQIVHFINLQNVCPLR